MPPATTPTPTDANPIATDPADLTLLGYLDPWNLRAGERVRVMLSDERERPCRIDLVRLVAHGAPPGEHQTLEQEVPGAATAEIRARRQPIRPGSCAVVPSNPFLRELESFTLRLNVFPTTAGSRAQALAGTWSEATRDGFGLYLDAGGVPTLRVGDGDRVVSCDAGSPLRNRSWVTLLASYDAVAGRLSLRVEPCDRLSPGLVPRPVARELWVEPLRPGGTGRALLFAAWHEAAGERGGAFDGRLEAPCLRSRADAQVFEARWDLSAGIETDRFTDTGPAALHGRLLQCPARGVTGSGWDASTHDWTRAPEQWGAIHFHSDDVADAGWQTDAELRLPDELPSGVYAVRVTSDDGRCERLPLFVRPHARAEHASVLFLVPTANYQAYANHRVFEALGFDALFGGGDLPFQRYLTTHPELGPNTYGFHADGSGCAYTSRLRPILNLRTDADGWAFSMDLALVGFLDQLEIPWDVATDDDLHAEGAALLAPYAAVLTGSHPEYWSTRMLDGLERWQRDGGRLLYLGGNGFYWRVAYSSHFPGVMEVRRVGPSTRAWPVEPGCGYHSFTGELGGLWRNIGRAPNRIAGVGFAAQGPGGSPYYRTPASRDPRAAWIFDGVEGEQSFGDYGRLGGAANEEIDRFDPALGSPPHALVLASSRDHGPLMLRVIEEFLITLPPLPDPDVRADLLFYETPAGGAVFSTGSISWIGSLAHDGYRNDVARITANVVRRFADPEPFVLPTAAPEVRAGRMPYMLPDASMLAGLVPVAGSDEG
jgi:N,N-dimethylformamidase